MRRIPRLLLPLSTLASLSTVTLLTACGASGGGVDGGQAVADLAMLSEPDLAPVVAPLVPPAGMSSMGSGGPVPAMAATRQADGITYRLIVPAELQTPSPLLIVYSGTEGGALMAQNLTVAGPATSTDGMIRAVLDGVVYRGNGAAGATVLDAVRALYDIDNDRTYLLGESAGTTAALELGFELRQSWFAAYWANDVNAQGAPAQTAAELGFEPWGQVGPGGDFIDARAIASAMRDAGYRLPDPAPYAGPGASQHGSKDQFVAALRFFEDKTRQ